MPHVEPTRTGASPGLLRRRYSVPETIMRKYRLAQQSNETEEPCAATSPSSSSAACGGCVRSVHPDRELMRKSALLRRLWGRAPAPLPAQRTSRSLHGSSSELRRSPAGSGWATPKRQRLEWTPRPASPPASPGVSPACSDCTFASHRARSPAAPRDVFARYSHMASDAARSPPAACSSSDSTATPSESLPTALPAPAPVPVPYVTEVDVDRYSSLPFDMLTTAGSPPYEVLEIVVSETVEAPRAPESSSPSRTNASSSPARGRACNINIDEYVSNILVESLNSLSEQLESMSAAVGGAGVVVEKEIKVRLQNTGVNTIVHLSPTSNHQIIFGNEELCHTDNEKRDACNNPRSPLPPSLAPEPNNNEPVDSVNRAVLQQIQKLFHDELYRLEPGPYPGEPTLTQIESSNVDTYIEHHTDSNSDSPSLTGLGVGAGNYWAREPALVPRLSALPHSASMEVNTSSSEAEPSACPSLVDSLDDPASPRAPPPARRLQRSAVDVLDLLPEAPPTRDKSEAFFVRITDEDCDCDKENVVVADRMPDRIRERLLRRHRKRELRMESRRGGGQEKARRRAADHDARAIVAALVDDLIAKIAQEEYKCMRIHRRPRADRNKPARNGSSLIEEHNGRIERALHGKLSLPPPDAPRRIYQKSEIHDGDKCIEILEILEYVDDSQNSPETTNSDEHYSNSKSKKSRIPIPIYERIQRTTKKATNRPRSPPPPPSPSPPPSARRASVPPPAEPRARAGSLRFRRVFDIIPEERGAGPPESPPASDEALARRVSAPSLPLPPPRSVRSAATSPPAPQRASRSTMTSPRRAAPSPPPAPPPAPRVAAGIALACAPCR
ncbi:uncharacterized protein LOC134806267 [Cydia splendana]|uniref:uncharacterized protein LOC134806267 n=1 Tax=Cydia splendana TaxID=1100963 RepID=UPI00300D2E32